MTWSFADSFDLYAAGADMAPTYWDSSPFPANWTFAAGRFAGSQSAVLNPSATLTKSSGVNDAVHHLVVSFEQTSAIGGTALGGYLELWDGTTAQCSIVFRTDGAILLTSGGPTGTVLDTWTGAFTGASIWYAFEIEVVINATTGSWAIRRGGNTVNDHAATGLNTQASANAYANKLTIGQAAGGGTAQRFDDLFWRSGAAAGTWLGDIRCYTRMPLADASVQFTPGQSSLSQVVDPNALANSVAASAAHAVPFVATYTGVLTGGTVNLYAASTGNMKFALYNAAGTTLLATSNPITNPSGIGLTPFTFPTPPAIIKGQTYYLAHDQDSTINCNIANTGLPATLSTTLAYASFPPASIAGWTSGATNAPAMIITFTGVSNSSLVSEAQQDSGTTYVYDSNPGDADFYNIATIPVTPAAIIATVVRGYMMKSDTGSRTAAVQLKSGATTVATPTLTLTNSGWQWTWRMDTVDPNTGAAWTPSAVTNAQIGPTVVA